MHHPRNKISGDANISITRPTPKAIQERLSKLRKEQNNKIEELGMCPPYPRLPVLEQNINGDATIELLDLPLADIEEGGLEEMLATFTREDLEAAASLMRAGEEDSVLGALAAQAARNARTPSPEPEKKEDSEEEMYANGD
jgi:hypothetical protein